MDTNARSRFNLCFVRGWNDGAPSDCSDVFMDRAYVPFD